jgi:hypothetical protein
MNVVVSAVLVMAFSIIVVGLVIQFGYPLIQEHKQELEFEQGKNLVNFLSFTISDLISEPINSSREIEIELKKGSLKISTNTISFSVGYKEYNKTFDKIQFNEIEIPNGKIKVQLTKISRDKIKIT